MAGVRATARRLGRALAVLVVLTLANAALAQAVQVPSPASFPILVVDQERLFSGSAFGQASVAREEEAARALEAENNRMQAELIAEEQALTVLRRSLPPEEFAPRAAAFDAKVERIRAAQEAKVRDLTAQREDDGKAFFAAIVPVLGQILADRGGLVILDKADVIVSLNAIDVTDEAIARVNQVLSGATSAP